MGNVAVQRIVDSAATQAPPLLHEIEEIFDQVRDRAFQIFSSNGHQEGHALEDWFAAERDLPGRPPAELRDTGEGFELRVALPGYAEADVAVAASPRQIIVQGKGVAKASNGGRILFSDFPDKAMLRQVELPEEVDLDRVVSTLDEGVLVVQAPKARVV